MQFGDCDSHAVTKDGHVNADAREQHSTLRGCVCLAVVGMGRGDATVEVLGMMVSPRGSTVDRVIEE